MDAFIPRWTVSLATSLQRSLGSTYTKLAQKTKRNPTPRLILFDYEASPYCRRVRQALTDLELSAVVLPCPRSTLFVEGAVTPRHRFRQDAAEMSKQLGIPLRFPMLVDTTNEADDVAVAESKHIIVYLWKKYGTAEAAGAVEASVKAGDTRFDVLAPWVPGSRSTRLKNVLNVLCDADLLGHALATFARPLGVFIMSPPDVWRRIPEGIELWGSESSPETRLVREYLSRAQVRYTLHSQWPDTTPRIVIPHTEAPLEMEIPDLDAAQNVVQHLAGYTR